MELSGASLRGSSTCGLLRHFKSKHAVLKPELLLKCEMSHKKISFKLVSVEASGGVGFVGIEVKSQKDCSHLLRWQRLHKEVSKLTVD